MRRWKKGRQKTRNCVDHNNVISSSYDTRCKRVQVGKRLNDKIIIFCNENFRRYINKF